MLACVIQCSVICGSRLVISSFASLSHIKPVYTSHVLLCYCASLTHEPMTFCTTSYNAGSILKVATKHGRVDRCAMKLENLVLVKAATFIQ